MGLGQLLGPVLNRNLVYDVTNTQSGAHDTYTIVTDGGPGMYPDWSAGAYRGLLGIPAADQAMMLIAGLIGRVPWCGYRKVAGRRPVKLDPEPTILDYPAGSFEIPLRTWHGWAMDRMAHGNGVGLVAARTPDGWPSAYTPVSAEMVSVARAGQGWMPAGFAEGEIVWYIGGRYYHQYEVIHFKGPAKPGDLRGMGVLENHFATLDRSRKLDRQASDVDANAVPTGLLKSLNPDLTQAEATALKDAWRTAQATRTVAVLNPSTEFEPISWSPTDAQLLEARQYTLTEWANIFGIDSSFLGGDSPKGTYANLEEKGLDLLRYGRPGEMVVEFEQTLTMQLPRGQYVKANMDFTLRPSTQTRYETHAIGIAGGFLTPDEARELEDRDPLTEQQRAQIQAANAKAPAGPAGQQSSAPVMPQSPGEVAGRGRLRAQLEVLDILRGRHSAPEPGGAGGDQPRWPEGSPLGGQWIGTSSSASRGEGAPASGVVLFDPNDSGELEETRPAGAKRRSGQGGGGDTGLKPYRLNDEKYCPTCGGKAQDPQMSDPESSAGFAGWKPDGTEVWYSAPESCDEPYHDKSDPDYQNDRAQDARVSRDPAITWFDEADVLDDDEIVPGADDAELRAADLSGGRLKAYWTTGPGLAKWRGSPTPWRALRRHLSKYLSGRKLDATTSAWYRIVFGRLPNG